MLRLIVQTERKYTTKNKERSDDEESTSDKALAKDERSQQNTTADSDEGNSTHTGCDQDSDVCFQSDSDDDMDTAETEEEAYQKKHKRHRGQDAGSQHSMLDGNTKENEMEIGNGNCFILKKD